MVSAHTISAKVTFAVWLSDDDLFNTFFCLVKCLKMKLLETQKKIRWRTKRILSLRHALATLRSLQRETCIIVCRAEVLPFFDDQPSCTVLGLDPCRSNVFETEGGHKVDISSYGHSRFRLPFPCGLQTFIHVITGIFARISHHAQTQRKANVVATPFPTDFPASAHGTLREGATIHSHLVSQFENRTFFSETKSRIQLSSGRKTVSETLKAGALNAKFSATKCKAFETSIPVSSNLGISCNCLSDTFDSLSFVCHSHDVRVDSRQETTTHFTN